ncbi:MAG: LysM peptidoglycan-binding domain-containing protein [Chloroflexota bacterium]|nr:LysM peptidoglycan-binding domain-containing protein [Chloroflexota bacterium]
MDKYTVIVGDTWERIAEKTGVPVEILLALNYIPDISIGPYVGTELFIAIPPPGALGVAVGSQSAGGPPTFTWITEEISVQQIQQQMPIVSTAYLGSNIGYDAQLREDIHERVSQAQFVPNQALQDWAFFIIGFKTTSPEEHARTLLQSHLYALYESTMPYSPAYVPLSYEDFLQSLDDVLGENYSTFDLMTLATQYASPIYSDISTDMYGGVDPRFQNQSYDVGVDRLNSYFIAEHLLEFADTYLHYWVIDLARQVLRTWHPLEEGRLIGAIEREVTGFPGSVLGIDTEVLGAGFGTFLEAIQVRHEVFIRLQACVDDYERWRTFRQEQYESDQQLLQQFRDIVIEVAVVLGVSTAFGPVAGSVAGSLFTLEDFLQGDVTFGTFGSLLLLELIGLRGGQFLRALGNSFAKTPISRLTRMDLAHIELTQALHLRMVAEHYGVDIHIAGRLADTVGEKANRSAAVERAIALAADDPVLSAFFRSDTAPDQVRIILSSEEFTGEALEAWQGVQIRVSNWYGREGTTLSPAQVKISSGESEVDFYIPPEQWAALNSTQQRQITDALTQILAVNKTDPYHMLDDIDLWVNPSSGGSPRWSPRNPPPGAIVFSARGGITHTEIGGR